MNGAPKVRWEFWIDGPRGPAIAGSIAMRGHLFQLAAHVGPPRRRPRDVMKRHDAMRLIRDELHRAIAS